MPKTQEESEKSALEKKMQTRYRGVKFFGAFSFPFFFFPPQTDLFQPAERQKLLRKIKQTKKQLLSIPDDAKLATALLESRIDLYYVLVRSSFPPPLFFH